MFEFKQFSVDDRHCGMKISSDSVLLGAWFLPQVSDASCVVDAGAGSGVLSLMAAQCCPHACICAVEIDPAAAAACRANVEASPWACRIEVVESDFASAALGSPDAIISNPPYFTETLQAPNPARAMARHQHTLTYSALLDRASCVLAEHGILGMVAPAADEQSLLFEGAMAGLHLQSICRVQTSIAKPPKRILCIFGRAQRPLLEDTLLVGSDAYRALVAAFYTKIH